MKILITGGSGFIGSALCRKLVSKGHRVSVLDLKKPFQPVPQVEYTLGDVRKKQDLAPLVSQVDAVFHFAALVSVPYCETHFEESYSTNFLGTLEVARAAIEAQKKGKKIPVFFSSSAAVYAASASGKKEALNEHRELPYPLSHYAAQKLASEKALLALHQSRGLPTLSFRFFNVFGPGQDPKSPYSGVITVFRNQAETGKPLLLYGGGNQTRDFIHIDDLAEACLAGLSLPVATLQGQSVNLGSGKSVTVAALAKIMAKLSKKKSPIRKAPSRAGDIVYSCSEISQAKSLLDWQPKISLESGLKDLFGAGSALSRPNL